MKFSLLDSVVVDTPSEIFQESVSRSSRFLEFLCWLSLEARRRSQEIEKYYTYFNLSIATVQIHLAAFHAKQKIN